MTTIFGLRIPKLVVFTVYAGRFKESALVESIGLADKILAKRFACCEYKLLVAEYGFGEQEKNIIIIKIGANTFIQKLYGQLILLNVCFSSKFNACGYLKTAVSPFIVISPYPSAKVSPFIFNTICLTEVLPSDW